MDGIKFKTIKGGEERTITYKRALLKLRHCDKASAFAGAAEMKRLNKLSNEEFEQEFNEPRDNKDIYILLISDFIKFCHLSISGTHLKELIQRVPKKLSGVVGLGVKIIYNSKKERGKGIEIRYHNKEVTFYKVIEEYK